MKVLHLFTLFPNPYQPYNERLIDRQRAAGIECSVFSFYNGAKSSSTVFNWLVYFFRGLLNITFVGRFSTRASKPLLQSLLFVGRISPLLRDYDVLHVHHVQNLTKDYLAFISTLNKPCVLSLRGSDALVNPLVSESSKVSFQNILQLVNGIHTVSRHLASMAIRYGATESKIHVIRRTPEEASMITSKAKFEGGKLILCTMGRYNWTKGYIFLLQAVRLLLDRGYDVQLNIIGDGSEEDRYEVLYWIDLLELTEAVVLCGYKSSIEINGILGQTHVYVQPSVSEGIPNTLTRVLANKIPVVVSRVGGIPEVVTEDNGILVLPGDSKSIADAIEKIVSDKTFRDGLYQKSSIVTLDYKGEIEKYIKFYQSAVLDFQNDHK